MLKLIKQFWLVVMILLATGLVEAMAKEEFIIHRTFYTPRGQVISGGISKDGRYSYAIDKNHVVRIWHYESGRPFKVLRTGNHKPLSSVMHPSKPMIFTSGDDGEVVAWDFAKGVKLASMASHTGPVTALAITSDGQFLASAGQDKNIIIWKLDRYKIHKKISENSRRVGSIDFHPNGRILAWSTGVKGVKIYDMQKNQELASHNLHKKKITQVKFHPSGDFVASASFDSNVILYNWVKKEVVRTFEGHTKTVTGIDFDATGKEMLTCSMDGSIRHWRLRTSKTLQEFNLVERPVKFCEFSSDANKVVGVFEKSYIRAWNMGTSSHMTSLEAHTKAIVALDINKGGNLMLSAGEDNKVVLWNLNTKEKVREFAKEGHSVQSVRFHPSGTMLATGGSNSDILLWDYKGKVLHEFKGHQGKINSIDFHPTESVMISAGADKKIIYWNFESKKKTFEKEVHLGQIHKIRFSGDGELFATASHDKIVKVFRYFDQQLLHTLKGHQRGVRDLAFSPAKDMIATAGDDTSIILWDLGSGETRAIMKGHEFIVSGIAFSTDGKSIVSASRDKTLRLWDSSKGQFIKTLSGQRDQISALALSPSGKYVASGTIANEINLLRLPKDLFQPFSLKRKTTSTAVTDTEQKGADPTAGTTTDASPDSTGDAGAQAKPPEESITEGDIAEEETYNRKDNVFEPPPKKVDHDLIKQQNLLDRLLKDNRSCANANAIRDASLAILKKDQGDQAAYYGMIMSSLVRQDLQMIYIMMKFGASAKLDQKKYGFKTAEEVETFFTHWKSEIFDPTVLLKANNVNVEFVDCYNEIQSLKMSEQLLHIEIPQEVIAAVIHEKSMLDFTLFQSLTKQELVFRDRVFGLINAVTKGERSITESTLYTYIPSNNVYGYFEVDMTNVRQWGARGNRLIFELKQDKTEWRTYLSNANKTKVLLLPKGNYYVKINDKVRTTFLIESSGQRIKRYLD